MIDSRKWKPNTEKSYYNNSEGWSPFAIKAPLLLGCRLLYCACHHRARRALAWSLGCMLAFVVVNVDLQQQQCSAVTSHWGAIGYSATVRMQYVLHAGSKAKMMWRGVCHKVAPMATAGDPAQPVL